MTMPLSPYRSLLVGLALALSLLPATAALSDEIKGEVDWPGEWTVFLPLEREDPLPARDVLEQRPETLEIAGRSLEPMRVEPEPDGTFDFAPLFGRVAEGNTAYAFLEIDSDIEQQVTLGMGADWWMQAWLDGREILNTTEEGNRFWPPSIMDHAVEVTLREGTNTLAVRFVSGTGSSVLALGGPDALREAPARNYAGVSEPPQGLRSLMERHGKKPYDLFQDDEGLTSGRVVFEDRTHGSEVWMLDDSPVVDHVRSASVWPAWNADATRLYGRGRRPFGEDTHRPFWNADFSRLLPYPEGYRPLWDRENPTVYFYRPAGRLMKGDTQSRESETLAEWNAYPRERSYGLTADNRYVFVDTPNGGIWLPYEADEDTPIPHVQMYDGRPGGLDEEGNAVPPRDQADELMFRGSPRGKFVEEHDEWGDILMVRIGMLIDRETGVIDHVIAPYAGEENYLRAFHEGRIDWPEGPEWDKYRIHKSDDLDEMFEIYRYYPMLTHGHESHSPDAEFVARDGAETAIIRARDGRTVESLRLSPDGTNYHLHWLKHPRFFVGWARGWHYRSFTRPENANYVYQIFTDGTAQPVFDTHNRFNGYYAGGDFSMQSPDATKIHTGSSMTGRFRNYVGVMARPRPPRSLEWEADEAAVSLSWEAPQHHRETRGYLVYRSERSGKGYAPVTTEPVTRTDWRDETVEPGEAYYYVVTSLEHSGLESGYSAEAARVGVDLSEPITDPLRVYVEAERAIRDLDTMDRPGLAMGRDVRTASDWYYVYRHPEVERGAASLRVKVPTDDRYHVWARVRSEPGQRARWSLDVAGQSMEAVTETQQWTWVHAGEITLEEGELELRMATESRGAALDLLCLSTDGSFAPEGARPTMTEAPSPVEGLEAANVRARTNRLTWDASPDPMRSHYNVYASREPFDEPSQAHLIASPTEPERIDWGLRAQTRYHYAVTAVDRRRNESEPVFAEARTPPRQVARVDRELAFAEGELEGKFTHGQAGGLRGPGYVLPEDPQANRVSWQVEIPESAEYYLWLRYLQRGDGSRGDTVDQRVRVQLNGEPLTTLGGGQTDLHAPDDLIEPDHPLSNHLWTWAWPGGHNLEGVRLPEGRHALSVEHLHEEIRYDVLLLTNEPSFQPADGRLRQR